MKIQRNHLIRKIIIAFQNFRSEGGNLFQIAENQKDRTDENGGNQIRQDLLFHTRRLYRRPEKSRISLRSSKHCGGDSKTAKKDCLIVLEARITDSL